MHNVLLFKPPFWGRGDREELGSPSPTEQACWRCCCSCRAWFFDQYSRIKGYSPGVVTGKVRTCRMACLQAIIQHMMLCHARGLGGLCA